MHILNTNHPYRGFILIIQLYTNINWEFETETIINIHLFVLDWAIMLETKHTQDLWSCEINT